MVNIESVDFKYNKKGGYTNVFITYTIDDRIEFCKGTIHHTSNDYSIKYVDIYRMIFIALQRELKDEVWIYDVRRF